MPKLLIFFYFLFIFVMCQAGDPDRFEIRQDRALRLFHILENGQFLGVVINRDYGIFDFYNHKREKEWVNNGDALYDDFGFCVGFVKFASYEEWFSRSLRIDLYSHKGEFLAQFEPEGDRNSFVFRDPQTQQVMAIAVWSKTRQSSLSEKEGRYPLQDWSVTIINPSKLQEKNISRVFLIWTLLKHSQKYFPSPENCSFEEDFEQDIAKNHEFFDLLFLQHLFPDQFLIKKVQGRGLFEISEQNNLLAIVTNSKARKFEFYDSQQRKLAFTRVDSCYENSGECRGYLQLKSDEEWIPPKSAKIDIFSKNGTLLATIETEISWQYFVFRDAETKEPLATAIWDCPSFISRLLWDDQQWSVTILNRELLEEKKIPILFLIWALLKHSEKYFPYFHQYTKIEDI